MTEQPMPATGAAQNDRPADSKGRAEYFLDRARVARSAEVAAAFAQVGATFTLAHQVEMLRADILDEGTKLRRVLGDIQKTLLR